VGSDIFIEALGGLIVDLGTQVSIHLGEEEFHARSFLGIEIPI
jgi:hypothetical protein